MPKDEKTPDLFEADGVTPKAPEKPVITDAQLELERRAAKAEGKAEGLEHAIKNAPKPAAEKPAAPEKVFTRAELRCQVNEGKITEDQMDDILERQFEAKLAKKVTETVESRVNASQVGSKVTADIAKYVEAFPDINKDGSALRGKIEKEFQDLVAGGASESALSTELAAIKIVCGSLKQEGRKPDAEGHQDIGGAGDGADKPETSGWAKGLTLRQKAHYEKMIAKGVYASTSDAMLTREIKRIRGAH